MKRRMRIILTSLCALAFISVLVLWCRSYFVADWWTIAASDIRAVVISSRKGEMAVTIVRRIPNEFDELHYSQPAEWRPVVTTFDYPNSYFAGVDWYEGMFGFIPERLRNSNVYSWREVSEALFPGKMLVVPHATMLAFVAALTALLLVWLRNRRQKLCLQCGYDLRESRGTCPECGAAIVGGGA